MSSTVQIICNNGNPNGHGVICKIAQQYYIITCTHIMPAPPVIGASVHIKFNNKSYTTTILKFLPKDPPLEEYKPYDLCLLQWDNIPPEIQKKIHILPLKLHYQTSAVTLKTLSGHLKEADNTCHGLHHFAPDNNQERTLRGDSGSPLILTQNNKKYWVALHDGRAEKKDASDGKTIFRSYAIPSYWIVSFFPEILHEDIKKGLISKELIPSEQYFYHPLQIGQKIFKQDKDDRKIPVYEFPHVPENAESIKYSFEIKNSDIFKKQWFQNKTGIFMLLGEPGGGKTTFLRQWSQEIIDQDADIIPLYIPLRDHATNDFAKFILHSYDNINATSCFSTDSQSSFRFIYLIDGLDEIDDKAQSEWLDRLNTISKYALCIITCRTAYYHQKWQTDYLKTSPYYLMGLFAHEKKQFLTNYATIKYGDKDKKTVEDWLGQWLQLIKTNPIIGHLSGSPLLLSLIAHIYNPDNYASLSDLQNENLADMYHNIVEGLIKQRAENINIINIKKILGLLAKEAFEKNNSTVFLSNRLFDDCSLENISDEKCDDYKTIILKSLVIKKKDHGYEWLHKTFMEYAYALYIKEIGNIERITDFFMAEWDKIRCHHVLILLWGMLKTSERLKIADKIRAGYNDTYKKSPLRFILHLWGMLFTSERLRISGKIRAGYDDTYKKSPLRFILHLYGKSNVCIKEYDPLYKDVKGYCKELKLALSIDEYTSPDVLEILEKDDDNDVRRAVVYNSNTSVDILTQLAQDDDKDVRWNVSENPNTPSHILEQLAQDDYVWMRQNVARNPNTPSHILEILAMDNNEYVRWDVVQHPNTPLHILEHLAKDDYVFVRQNVAENSNTPPDVLEQLAKDDDWYVRRYVAHNPNTPSHILEILAMGNDEYVQRNVAENLNTPPNILEHLAKDDDWGVRRRVAQNPNTPSHILEHLAKDDDFEVRWHIIKNPNSHLEWYL